MKRAHDVDDNKAAKSSRGDTDEGRDSKCVFFSVVVRKRGRRSEAVNGVPEEWVDGYEDGARLKIT